MKQKHLTSYCIKCEVQCSNLYFVTMKNKIYNFLLPFFFLITFNVSSQQPPKYEMRAVWIATVENIDWPGKKGLPVQQQKEDFSRILNMHQRNGMNTVIVQVRPAADAFYSSGLEPWSEYLNGRQGLPPSPYYDPLEFMINETHSRGMEFHAWINPFRAVVKLGKSSIAANHIIKQHPEWAVTYGTYKWLDPGLPQVREHTANVVKDLVTRYDVDAIHMDDYFYPYRIPGKDFPDAKSYRLYGNGKNKADWRRANVDSTIKLIRQTIVAANPRVKLGISPFGIWRNKKQDPEGSATNGSSNYDDLYANVLLWLQQGWIDYVAPQLYWHIGHKLADYAELLTWWSHHTYGAHLYIGHGIYRYKESGWRNRNELPQQLQLLRANKNVHGSVYYSSKIFNYNPHGWNDSLRNNYYALPAIVPPMKWIDSVPPPKPMLNQSRVRFDGKNLKLAFTNKSTDVRNYAFYYSAENNINVQDVKFLYAIIPAAQIENAVIKLPASDKKINHYLKITAIDINNNESEAEQLLLFR